jgi:hypothetical protein
VNVTVKAVIGVSMALFLAACGDSAKLPEEAAFGPNPTLPEPTRIFYRSLSALPLRLILPPLSVAGNHFRRPSLHGQRIHSMDEGRIGPCAAFLPRDLRCVFLYGLSSLGTGHTAAYFSFSGLRQAWRAHRDADRSAPAAALAGSRA